MKTRFGFRVGAARARTAAVMRNSRRSNIDRFIGSIRDRAATGRERFQVWVAPHRPVVQQSCMAFVKVASLSALPSGSVMEVTLGEDSYAICTRNAELHPPWGTCPPAAAPIVQGPLDYYLL